MPVWQVYPNKMKGFLMRILSLALPLALAVSSVAAGPISFGGAGTNNASRFLTPTIIRSTAVP